MAKSGVIEHNLDLIHLLILFFFFFHSLAESSKGNEFFLGFIGSSVGYAIDESPSAVLLVATDEPDPVSFTVKYLGETMNKTARQGQTVRIVIQIENEGSDIRVKRINERNKGIHVKAEGKKLLTVYGINDARTESEGFLALPCHNYPGISKYNYSVFSMKTIHPNELFSSRFLIVGCEADTTLKVIPTARVQLPNSTGSIKKQIGPNLGDSAKEETFTIRSLETLMLESPDDLTGTIIRSDKPISVFVGHECGRVPDNKGRCNHLVEQIPPDITWGKKFFTVPLGLRESGERYRIWSFANKTVPTVVTVTCTTEGETQPSLEMNETIIKKNYTEFDTIGRSSVGGNSTYRRDFCCIETTKPSIVMMYAKGKSVDMVSLPGVTGNLGNPAMVLVPPMSQYSNNFTISTVRNLTVANALYSYISYALPIEYFDNTDADRAAFTVNNSDFTPDSNYHPIFCSNRQICGYGAYSPINKEGNHIVRYNKMTAGMYLYVYHFMKKSTGDITSPMIAYPAGFSLDPNTEISDNDCPPPPTTGTSLPPPPTTVTSLPPESTTGMENHTCLSELKDQSITVSKTIAFASFTVSCCILIIFAYYNIQPDNIIDVLMDLAQEVKPANVDCQTPENLEIIARIFNMIANITQAHRLNSTSRNTVNIITKCG